MLYSSTFYIYLPIYLSIYLSIYLFVYLSIYLSIYIYIYIYLYQVKHYQWRNSTVRETHKPNIPLRLFTNGFRKTIENLTRFLKGVWDVLTNNIETRIRDFTGKVNSEMISDNTVLVSFDMVNMYLCVDNNGCVVAIRNALEKITNRTPSTVLQKLTKFV